MGFRGSMQLAVDANLLDENMRQVDADSGQLAWHTPTQAPFSLHGLCFFDEDRVYRRMPVNPAWPLRPEVDALANATAGGQIRFRTDSRVVAVRVQLAGPANMDHMPATGQCGFDAYVGDLDPTGFTEPQYWGTARPIMGATQYSSVLFEAESS